MMASSAIVFLLVLSSASVYALSIERELVKLDDPEVDVSEMMFMLDRFLATNPGNVDNLAEATCAERLKDHKHCRCEQTSCECCREESIFFVKPHHVCVSMVYVADGDDYEVVLSSNGESIFVGRIDKQGVKDVSQKITAKSKSKSADLTMTYDCQKENKDHVTGCVKIEGMFDKDNDKIKDKVGIDFGCFTLKK